MLPHERRWAQAIMEAFAPPGAPEGLSPEPGEVDYVGWLEAMMREGTPLAAAGLRAALYGLNAAPLLVDKRAVSLASLPLAERTRILDTLLSSDDYALRELALLFKIQVSTALFLAPGVRARSNYDRDRGAAFPRRLPLLQKDARR
jgi:hypothetical protein